MSTGPADLQGVLVRLSDKLGEQTQKVTGALARLTPGDARRYMTDAYPEIASPFLAAAGDISATWYEEQPTKKLAGRSFLAKPAALPDVDQLAANGRWALTQKDPGAALVGSSRRATFNQSRETILNNAEEEGVRWVRHARSGACGFCRMLATRAISQDRGAAPGLYRSEGSASRNTHRKSHSPAFEVGHDFCRCIVLPLRDGATYVAPDYLPQWLDDYDAVAYGPDDRLLPPQQIANRMEAIGRERGDYGDVIRGRKGAAGPDVVNLDVPPVADLRSRIGTAQSFTERNATAAESFVQPVRDRVQQAATLANRADAYTAQAASVSGRVKSVVDVANKLTGGSVPIVRNVKTIVDAADKGLQTAAGVTGEAAKIAKLAAKTLKDATAIAHGVKQVADQAVALVDEGAAIAVGVRSLATDAGKAVRDARMSDAGLRQRLAAAAADAERIHADASGLTRRARLAVEDAQNLVATGVELPTLLTKPVEDVRKLAANVKAAAGSAEQAIADSEALNAALRRLADTAAEFRRRAPGPRPGPPIRVTAERLDIPADPRALAAGDRTPQLALDAAPLDPLDVAAFDLPERQLAITRVAEPLALEAKREPLMLTAGPGTTPVTKPEAGKIAEWLAAEDDHLAALERWRDLDAARALPAAEAIPDVVVPAAEAVLERELAGTAIDAGQVDAGAVAGGTKGDSLRAALAEAQRIRDLPDDRVTAQGRTKAATTKRTNRAAYNKAQVEKAQAELDAAIADGTVDDALVVKAKRAKSRPLAEVEAERRVEADAAITKATDDFEFAVASGDDDAIQFALDHMEAIEDAEVARRAAADEALAKIAAKHEKQRARREADKQAEQEEILRVAEANGAETDADYLLAEAEVVAKRTGKSEAQVLEAIRKREYVKNAELKGKGFEDTLKNEFAAAVEQAMMAAEDATNGVMLKKQYTGIGNKNAFDPVNLWYCNEATARKVMSEEMANWFDANGRITLPVMRAMILDGETNFARRTVLTEDFLQ